MHETLHAKVCAMASNNTWPLARCSEIVARPMCCDYKYDSTSAGQQFDRCSTWTWQSVNNAITVTLQTWLGTVMTNCYTGMQTHRIKKLAHIND